MICGYPQFSKAPYSYMIPVLIVTSHQPERLMVDGARLSVTELNSTALALAALLGAAAILGDENATEKDVKMMETYGNHGL